MCCQEELPAFVSAWDIPTKHQSNHTVDFFFFVRLIAAIFCFCPDRHILGLLHNGTVSNYEK